MLAHAGQARGANDSAAPTDVVASPTDVDLERLATALVAVAASWWQRHDEQDGTLSAASNPAAGKELVMATKAA